MKYPRLKVAISLFGIFLLSSCSTNTLPTPEIIGGAWGQFGIDKNINVTTIDNYLKREDTIYHDMRMLVDPADFSVVGGDSHLSGFINGFSVIPYPILCDKLDLPAEVGVGYQGETLFSFVNNEYRSNYNESMAILESLFPRDKNIFVMCGAGGYALSTKTMLISLGWNKDKIWNVGCYWSYVGNNNVEVRKTNNEGETYYDFAVVDYRNIDFSCLHSLS